MLLFGHCNRYWFDKHNKMMVTKLGVKSVQALHLEGHCDNLSENLKVNKYPKLCYI